MDPILTETRLRLALSLHQAGNLEAAERLYQETLSLDADNALALNNLGILALQAGRAKDSVSLLEKCCARHPAYGQAIGNLALSYLALERFEQARDAFLKALEQDPANGVFYANLAGVYLKLGRNDLAEQAFAAACARRPDDHGLAMAMADLLREREAFEAAEGWYRRVLAFAPHRVDALVNLGASLAGQGRNKEAAEVYRQAIDIDPSAFMAYDNLGSACLAMRKSKDALAAFKEAARLNASFAPAHVGQALALEQMGRIDEAVRACEKALKINPEEDEAFGALGAAFYRLDRYDQAAWAYEQAEKLRPGRRLVMLLAAKRICCDWRDIETLERRLGEVIDLTKEQIQPFALLGFGLPPDRQKEAAIRICKARFKGVEPLPRAPAKPRGERPVIGYISSDLHNHPVTRLIVETVENHDRQAFDVCVYSCGPDDDGPFRRRIRAAATRFIDLAPLSNEDAAALIRKDGVDVLVDLTGNVQHDKSAILALRPAPAQVSYLGYPGTMGADFIDYILGDDYVTSPCRQNDYVEKIVSLPGCFQPGDSRRQIAAASRDDIGVSSDAVVLSAFNNSYKITPALFSLWMKLLKARPQCRLWLYANEPYLRDNLRREAKERGVNPDWLIFTGRQPIEAYLGNLALSDLFLDSFPFNGGATANDALWSETPLLTLSGEGYVSRMAGSLLTALGLPELIASSFEDYEKRALWLIDDSDARFRIREKLRAAKKEGSVFDSRFFAAKLERAYLRMIEIDRAGLPPQPISFAIRNG